MLTSFSALVERYRVIFFDAYGVLKISSGILPGVADVLLWLRQSGKDLYVITNDASRSPALMADTYTHPDHGALIAPSQIVSSGLLVKDFLRSRVRSGEVAYLGTQAASFYIESAGLHPIPVASCTAETRPRALVLLDDEGFDWMADINRAVNLVRRLHLPVVCANPDAAYPVAGGDVSVATGSLATLIEGVVGNTVLRFGKPDVMIFSHAFACALANDGTLAKEEVLMVGDTLHTDILGANAFGIDTALVLSGNTRPEDAATLIATSGIVPTHVCESIVS